MGCLPLRYKLLAGMPRFTWPYLNDLLALAGADIHFRHSNQKREKQQAQVNRLFGPLLKLIGRLKLYLL